MAMEDPEPWIKIPAPYKDLHTESERDNRNITSLKTHLGDKFKRKSFLFLISARRFFCSPWFAGQSPPEKSSAFQLSGKVLLQKEKKLSGLHTTAKKGVF